MKSKPETMNLSTLRIVCVALIAGQVIFAGVVAFLIHGTERQGGFGGEGLELVATIAAGFAVLMVPVAFLLRGARLARLAALEPGARLQGYAQTTIMFFALLEGASLFNIVAWLLTGMMIPSLPVVVVLVAIAMASFPSETHLEQSSR